MAEVEGQVVEEEVDMSPAPSVALVPQLGSTDLTLFGHDDPEAVIERASRIARVLVDVVRQQKDKRKLLVPITNKRGEVTSEHPRLEAWTLIGSQVGVFPVFAHDRRLRPDVDDMNGWEAKYEARKRDGSVVGSATSMCLRSESRWENAAEFEVRSMANTRAAAKAMRMALSFVMTLAGYDPTPAEEMEAVMARQEAAEGGRPTGAPGKPAQKQPGKGRSTDVGSLRNAVLTHAKWSKAQFPIAKVRGASAAELEEMLAKLNGEAEPQAELTKPPAETPTEPAAEPMPTDVQTMVDTIKGMPTYDDSVYGAVVAAAQIEGSMGTLQELLERLREEAQAK